jgi:hypothetical protein
MGRVGGIAAAVTFIDDVAAEPAKAKPKRRERWTARISSL